MSLEDQLKELLDKLDMVMSMGPSGARTRRIRLLRREINSVRYKHDLQRHLMQHNGSVREEKEEEEEDENCVDDSNNVHVASLSSSPDKGEQSYYTQTWMAVPGTLFSLLDAVSTI